MILAALHDLALAGRAPALAAAYAAADGDAAAGAAIDTLLRMTDGVVAIAVRRQPRSNETGRCTVLYPAIAEAARRVGANAVGLIDVGCSFPSAAAWRLSLVSSGVRQTLDHAAGVGSAAPAPRLSSNDGALMPPGQRWDTNDVPPWSLRPRARPRFRGAGRARGTHGACGKAVAAVGRGAAAGCRRGA